MERVKNNAGGIDRLINELDGWSDVGATREAQRVIKKLLGHPALTVRGLWSAVNAIGIGPNPRKWRGAIEEAFTELSPRGKREAGNTMLAYYHMINDTKAALPFCKISRLNGAADVMFAMDVLLEEGRILQARKLVRRAEKMLSNRLTAFEASSIIDAAASFYARTHNWNRALELWSVAPRDQAVSRSAAVGIVEIFIAQALKAAQRELAVVAKLKQRTDPDKALQLSVPGIEEKILGETEDALARIKRGLERLLPDQRRKNLGLISETVERH